MENNGKANRAKAAADFNAEKCEASWAAFFAEAGINADDPAAVRSYILNVLKRATAKKRPLPFADTVSCDTDYKCARCGYKWNRRGKAKPKTCPLCRSPNWDRPSNVIHCFKCNHVWATRGDAIPQRCARCNAVLTRRAILYGMSLKDYRRSKRYKELTAIFRRSQKQRRRRG